MSPDDQHEPRGDEAVRTRLRAADPAASLPPVGRDRVRQLLEATMADDRSDAPAESAPSRRPRWPAAVAAAAVLVLGGVVVGVTVGGDDGSGGSASDAPAATDDTETEAGDDASPADTAGSPEGDGETALSLTAAAPPRTLRCRMVTAEALAGLETAFDGTVSEIADGSVTFEVDRWFAGGDVDVVEVLDPPGFRAALEGPPPFDVGQRFLVTASEGQVTGCGFSAPYSGRLERTFERAFS